MNRNIYLTQDLNPFKLRGLKTEYPQGYYSKEELPEIILGSSFILDISEMVEVVIDHRGSTGYLNLSPRTDYESLRKKTYRKVNLNIDSKEQMLKVKGLGEKTVNKILELRINNQLNYENLSKIKSFDNWKNKVTYI